MLKSLTLAILFFFTSLILIFLNLLAFMRLIPIYITLPLLFISLYLTLYCYSYRHAYQTFRKRH